MLPAMLLLLACWIPSPPAEPTVLGTLDVADTGDSVDPLDDVGGDTDTAVEPADSAEPPPPRIVINEAMPKNRSTIRGVTGGFPDWVELYNADVVPVPLRRVTLTDGGGRVWMGPDVDLAPGERLYVEADDGASDGSAPFSLDSDGDSLTLAFEGAVTDRIALGALDADVAWARHPDGGEWAPTITVTPDAPNPDAPSATLDLTDTVFQLDTLHTVDITLSATAYASLQADRLTYVQGAVTVDDIPYDTVGVRLKAYVGSSRTIDQKCGFKVDLNRYVPDQEWRGLEMLTLNNMVQDYTYVHEYLAYEVFRSVGVPSPRVGYARVSVNGTDYGLYLFIESIDDRFLDRWYADSSGALYEGAYGVDLMTGYEASFSYDEGPEPADTSDLTAVIDVLNGEADNAGIAALEELVDLDEVLANMAAEALLLHWDGYTTRNNYRLYHDPVTGRFQIIPWGADQTFLTLYYGPWSSYGQIFNFCLANTACAARYDAILYDASLTMDGLDLISQAQDLHAWLYPEIETDPRREFGLDSHGAYYAATLSTIATWPASVRDQVEAR
jgi:hypothetical protein